MLTGMDAPLKAAWLYLLFLQEVLLLLPVRLDRMLWQKLHQLQGLFNLHQNVVDFASFYLQGRGCQALAR